MKNIYNFKQHKNVILLYIVTILVPDRFGSMGIATIVLIVSLNFSVSFNATVVSSL
jgi:hypothetical protein